MVWRYLLVFLAASFFATFAGPLLGRLMGLEPLGVWVASALGPIGGVALIVALGSWMEARARRAPWAARFLGRVERARAAAERLCSHGGMAAIALVTPITVGFTMDRGRPRDWRETPDRADLDGARRSGLERHLHRRLLRDLSHGQ